METLLTWWDELLDLCWLARRSQLDDACAEVINWKLHSEGLDARLAQCTQGNIEANQTIEGYMRALEDLEADHQKQLSEYMRTSQEALERKQGEIDQMKERFATARLAILHQCDLFQGNVTTVTANLRADFSSSKARVTEILQGLADDRPLSSAVQVRQLSPGQPGAAVVGGR